MAASQLTSGGISPRLFTRELNLNTEMGRSLLLQNSRQLRSSYVLVKGKRLRYIDAVGRASLSTNCTRMMSPLPVMRRRRHSLSGIINKSSSDYSVQTSDIGENFATEEEVVSSNSDKTVPELNGISTSVASDKINVELIGNATNITQSQGLTHLLSIHLTFANKTDEQNQENIVGHHAANTKIDAFLLL